MPRNGSGAYTRPHDWTADADAGIDIRADRMDEDSDDIAQALSDSIAKDGQTATTQIIPFASGIKTNTLSPVTANGPIDVTAGQFKFPASQNPSSNVNTLDDYEEGTWTPTDQSGSGVGVTVINASYIKIGRLVTITCALTFDSALADASAVFLGGLPFPCVSTSVGPFGWGICGVDNGLTLTARAPGSTVNQIGIFTTSNVSATVTQMTSGPTRLLSFSLTYITTN